MSTIKLTVNGKAVSAEVEDRTFLVHLLRENLNLTGTHNSTTRMKVFIGTVPDRRRPG